VSNKLVIMISTHLVLALLSATTVLATQDGRKVTIHMPGVKTEQDNDYMCVVEDIPDADKDTWITAFYPEANERIINHMILYGCKDKLNTTTKSKPWKCNKMEVCEQPQELFAWVRMTPSTELPKGVGFKIGKSMDISYMVLQVHYQRKAEVEDKSGFSFTVTDEKQKYRGGILQMISGMGSFKIPPNTPETDVGLNCVINTPVDITLFAAAVHTHKLGRAVAGYKVDQQNAKMTPIHISDPRWPQSYYPLKQNTVIKPRDLVATVCVYDSTGVDHETVVGPSENDEMCYMYYIYYTDAEAGKAFFECGMEQIPILKKFYPKDILAKLTVNKKLEDMGKGVIPNNQKFDYIL